MFGKGRFDGIGDMGGRDDSLVRSFWGVMAFYDFRIGSFFGDEFYRGAEEVVKESPFIFVEVIEERHEVEIV